MKMQSGLKIVVADKGFVFVGMVLEGDGPEVVITNTHNLRRWGTTRGLGELVSGPTDKTEHDPWGTVVTVPIIRLDCPANSRWNQILGLKS